MLGFQSSVPFGRVGGEECQMSRIETPKLSNSLILTVELLEQLNLPDAEENDRMLTEPLRLITEPEHVE